jgi:hypothetical protein
MKVALVCIVKEEEHLHEWIRWHRALGFDDIYLICNDWTPPEGLNAIIIRHPGIAQQMKAYNAWIAMHKTEYEFAAFFDADEYLYLVKHNSVKELLADCKVSLAINWVFFGSREDGINVGEMEDNGVVTRFKYRANKTDPHVKSIVKLQHNTVMNNPHYSVAAGISPEGEVVLGPHNKKGSMETVFIAHYWTQTQEYFRKKINRGRADTGKKFGHKMVEWEQVNAEANEVLDERLSNKYKQL